MKIKKTKKSKKMYGRKMGTHGGGARKNRKGSGHHGGKGLAGTGKRADHKKTLITKMYGGNYFGKQGITSKKTERDKRKRINIGQVQENLQTYLKKGLAKKTAQGYEINLEGYKILGQGEVKNILIIKAKEASKSCIKKVEKAKGKIISNEKKSLNQIKSLPNEKSEQSENL